MTATGNAMIVFGTSERSRDAEREIKPNRGKDHGRSLLRMEECGGQRESAR